MNPWLIAVACAILLVSCQIEKYGQSTGMLPSKAKKQGLTAPRVHTVPYFGPVPRPRPTII